ncbi:IL-4 receptor [Solea senegalensis]|nr:IL-4 receptor [Solea senegalensis]
MSCEYEAQNCSDYNVSLRNNVYNETNHCVPMQSSSGRCRCSVNTLIIYGESQTAMIWKGGQMMESKIIDIYKSIKPRVPEIISVEEANGKFLIKWKTNMDGWLAEELHANVMYHKKGDTEEVNQRVDPTMIDKLNIYEIDGRNLEPSTTYVVSVKSYTDWSDKFSDSSKEFEFTTPAASSNSLPLALIISLSIASILISGVIFGCFVKLKTKWWDTVAKCPNPKLLVMHPYEQAFLRPELLITSYVSVEPLIPDDCPWSKGSLTDSSSEKYQQSSGISTGSSSLSYANAEPTDIAACVNEALSKAFPNIVPMSFVTTNLSKESNRDSGSFSSARADNIHSDSFGFDNKTYSILIPSCSHQTQAKMLCDSEYHPSEADITVTCPDQQAAAFLLNLPLMVPSQLATDMSYQRYKADSGQLSYVGDSSLSSNSSGAHTMASCETGVEAGCESFDEVVSCETKPIGKSGDEFPSVDDANQAFQKEVGQPGPERQEFWVKYPVESFAKFTPGSIHNVQSGQCQSELQRHLFSLISAEKPVPVITSSGYQSV